MVIDSKIVNSWHTKRGADGWVSIQTFEDANGVQRRFNHPAMSAPNGDIFVLRDERDGLGALECLAIWMASPH
jgi:hypothetical protein